MADVKQVISLQGVGGYIAPEDLEKLLEQKFGREIKVIVRMPKLDRPIYHAFHLADRISMQVKIDSYLFHAPEKPTEVSAKPTLQRY